MWQSVLMAWSVARRAMRHRLWLVMLAAIASVLLLPAGAALADPVAPMKVSFTQPNGTVIVCTPFGDEYYSGYEYQDYDFARPH